MKLIERLALAVRRIMGAERPQAGRIIVPRREDSWRDYVSNGLTPSRLMAVLREADSGDLSAPMQLYEEMEEKDPHLYSVANTRRLALTGLEWRIAGAAEFDAGVDAAVANEAAAYCGEVLRSIESFDDVLQHLSLAIGRNIAIAELVWDVVDGALRIVEIAPVDFTRIVFDELDRPRILTESEPMNGIPLPANKFIVHAPYSASGHPSRGGLLRVTALAYLAKNLALKDWMIFAELFGMPVRVAQYEPSASAEEKKEMLDMLQSLGSNAAGIFSRAVDLKIIEANRGSPGPPYEHLLDFLNREMSKAWLGQTLTTETTGASGALTATAIHDQVRKDLRADDLRKEARTLRRDLLGPMTRMRFGEGVPVPYFRRKPVMPRDTQDVAAILDTAINKLGLSVPIEWMHETLGVPVESKKKKAKS